MANIGIISDYGNRLRRLYIPDMLKTAMDNLVLSQFAKKTSLPKKGDSNNTVRFFRWKPTTLSSAGVVQDSTTGNTRFSALTEGTPLSTYTDAADFEVVDCTLVQKGCKARVGDLTDAQSVMNFVGETAKLFGREIALDVDQQISQELVSGALSANKIYAGGATSSSTLDALSQSAGALTMVELLRAVTNIKANRGMLKGGKATAVIPVQAELDIQQDADWIDAHNYADPKARVNGELGCYGAVRIVSTTNAFQEDLADAAEGTYDSADTNANTGYLTHVFGEEAFGDVSLTGQSPYSPYLNILASADKSDPLNQMVVIGAKYHFVAKMLNSAWHCAIRHKVTL